MQVVLAVDCSRSMAENGCGGFALEAVTLLTRALSRLEVRRTRPSCSAGGHASSTLCCAVQGTKGGHPQFACDPSHESCSNSLHHVMWVVIEKATNNRT